MTHSGFCGKTFHSDCIKQLKVIPDKKKKSYPICDKCSLKFFVKDLYEEYDRKHTKEMEELQVAKDLFQKDYKDLKERKKEYDQLKKEIKKFQEEHKAKLNELDGKINLVKEKRSEYSEEIKQHKVNIDNVCKNIEEIERKIKEVEDQEKTL